LLCFFIDFGTGMESSSIGGKGRFLEFTDILDFDIELI
jgi:hypothetical protein